ncbi:MAG: bifunctional riboflavin kinase/FAD synthetase [Solirubrobacterales bacterium]
MRVHRSPSEVPAAPTGRAVALGTFDGVHRGHRRVIGSAVERARERGLASMVATFDPHPLRVLRPEQPPRLLTTTDQKIDLISELGVDELVAIPFTPELSRQSAEDFCEQVLAGTLAARSVSVGANFRFGHGAAGDAALLRARPEFETEVVDLVQEDGDSISSSRIRGLLAEGEVAHAAELLGAPYSLVGPVVEGDRRGRDLGVPTANIEPHPDVVVPAPGIYAGMATPDGDQPAAAAVSIGVRPTFESGGDVRVEAHLIDFEGDLYGRTMKLSFLERLRDEVRFDSPEELVEQMQKDVEQARAVAATVSRSWA